jgi:glycosyltransferase involved in cell wall biosynthesis
MLSIATQRQLALTRKLRSRGWAVHVLSVEPECEQVAETKTDWGLMSDIPDGVTVHRVSSLRPQVGGGHRSASGRRPARRSILAKLRGRLFLRDAQERWMRAAQRHAERIVREKGIDLVYVSVPPHSLLVLAARLQRRDGMPVVLDFRDNWATNSGAVFVTPLHRWLAYRTEATAITRSALVISVQSDLLITWNVPQGMHVPNGYDESLFPPIGEVRRNPRFTLSYLGSLYGGRSPEALFRAIGALRQEQADLADVLSVEFWGWNWNADIMGLAQSYGIVDTVHAMGVLKYRQALLRLCQSDMLLLVIPRSGAGKEETVFTGKLFEYLYSGNPILALAPTTGAAAHVIRENGAGHVVEPDDWKGVRDILRDELDAFRRGERRPVCFHPVPQFSRSVLNDGVEQALARIVDARREPPGKAADTGGEQT